MNLLCFEMYLYSVFKCLNYVNYYTTNLLRLHDALFVRRFSALRMRIENKFNKPFITMTFTCVMLIFPYLRELRNASTNISCIIHVRGSFFKVKFTFCSYKLYCLW